MSFAQAREQWPLPRRPQFTLRAVLVLMLAVACFFGGIRFERERRRREAEAAAKREHAIRVYPVLGPRQVNHAAGRNKAPSAGSVRERVMPVSRPRFSLERAVRGHAGR